MRNKLLKSRSGEENRKNREDKDMEQSCMNEERRKSGRSISREI